MSHDSIAYIDNDSFHMNIQMCCSNPHSCTICDHVKYKNRNQALSTLRMEFIPGLIYTKILVDDFENKRVLESRINKNGMPGRKLRVVSDSEKNLYQSLRFGEYVSENDKIEMKDYEGFKQYVLDKYNSFSYDDLEAHEMHHGMDTLPKIYHGGVDASSMKSKVGLGG